MKNKRSLAHLGDAVFAVGKVEVTAFSCNEGLNVMLSHINLTISRWVYG